MGFNVLYSNTLTGANANPFDSVNWTPFENNNSFALQVLNNVGIGQSGEAFDGEYYSGSVLSGVNDQWISFAVANAEYIDEGSAFRAYVRATGTFSDATSGYEIVVEFGVAFGSMGGVFLYDSKAPFGDIGSVNVVINQNDVFLLTATGSTVAVYQNGIPIIAVTNTSTPSGGTTWIGLNPPFELYANTAITNLQLGSVTTQSISGTITAGGSPLAGVTVTAVGQVGALSSTTTTASDGTYSLSGLLPATYTVTPNFLGYIFIPVNQSETVSGSNITGVNFTAIQVVFPTNGTIIEGNYQNQSNLSNAVMGAFPQNANRQQLDLIQIIATGGQVVWKLDYTGTVTVNPTSWTKGTLLGQFYGASWAACFQQNNTNPYNYDILQIRDTGGQVVWWLDYTGTVYSTL